MFWFGGAWRPFRTPGDLLAGLFTPTGVWLRFPGLDRPVRGDPREIALALARLARARPERTEPERSPGPELARLIREEERAAAERVRAEREAARRSEGIPPERGRSPGYISPR